MLHCLLRWPLRLARRGRAGAGAGGGCGLARRLGVRAADRARPSVCGAARGVTGGRPCGGRFGARGRRCYRHARPARQPWKPGRAGDRSDGNIPRRTGARVDDTTTRVPSRAVPTRRPHRVLPDAATGSGCWRERESQTTRRRFRGGDFTARWRVGGCRHQLPERMTSARFGRRGGCLG